MIRGFLGLIAVGWLSACAVGGPLQIGEAQPDSYPETHSAEAANGEQLPMSVWEGDPDGPILLAVHGFGDYGPLTFGSAAKFWAKTGVTTYAYDQRGFGRTKSRGHWPGADGLAGDLIAVAAQIRQREACRSLYVVGHSMGGGVALAAAARGLDADGIVLAAPAIWGGWRLNPFHRSAAWLAAAIAPEKRFSGRGVVRIQASDNLDAIRSLQRDPLYLSPPSARELLGLVRVTDLAAGGAGRVSLPALLLLGEKDQIVKNDLAEDVFGELNGPRETIRYSEGWHLLFRDLQAENVWKDVANWVFDAHRSRRRVNQGQCGVGHALK